MSSTLEASVFMGKITHKIYIPSKKTGNNLTLKQMFDISEKLISEQSDEWIQLTGRSEDNERECNANATRVFVFFFAKRFPPGRYSFRGPGSEKKWYSTHEYKPQGEWDRVAELMMLKFGESGHPVFRATSPLSRGTLKSKGDGKLSIHFCADQGTIETVFRTIISVNQLSIYGAVSDSYVCDEYRACQARTGRPVLGRTIWPIVWASKCVDDTHLDLRLKFLHKKSHCKSTKNEFERLPKQDRVINKDLYLCSIPDNSWSRTVLHDKRHWRILKIHRFSGLSWVHFTMRWKIIWPERLDSREHQNWARVRSHNQLPAR